MSRYVDIEGDWVDEAIKTYSLGYYDDDEYAIPFEALDSAPTIKTKQVKYFDEDEKVWKIGEVIVSDSEKPNNCEDEFFREPTAEERKAIADYIDSISVPTGVIQMKTQNSNLTFEKRTMRDCYNCERYETEDECIECHYEPKDECAKEYEELGLKELKELIEADRKTEPTSSKMEQVDKDINVRSKDKPHIVGKHADAIIIDESRLTAKCLNCANGGSYKCSKCDGEMYFKDEPQTCEDCRHNGVKHAYDYACDKCTDMDKFQHEDEPQREVIMPKKCKGCDSASKIIEAYAKGFEDGAEAVKAMPQTGRSE